MPEQFLFTKEKDSLFNVKVWMKLLVKKSTLCYGNKNRNRNLEDTRMKIVIINGSAREGNTLTAINAFIKGALEKNEIEIIEPDKLNIAPCKGCGVCQCSKGCV